MLKSLEHDERVVKSCEAVDKWLRNGAADKIEVVQLEHQWDVEDGLEVHGIFS